MFKALFGTLAGMTRTKYPSGIIGAALGLDDGFTGNPKFRDPDDRDMLEEHLCEPTEETIHAYRLGHAGGRLCNLTLRVTDRVGDIADRFAGRQAGAYGPQGPRYGGGFRGPPPPHGGPHNYTPED